MANTTITTLREEIPKLVNSGRFVVLEPKIKRELVVKKE